MAPFPHWASLLPELVSHIGYHIGDLKSYASARCACTAWRRAMAPPTPAILAMVPAANANIRWCRPYAVSLRTQSPYELASAIDSESGSGGPRCVGASNGWLALAADVSRRPRHTVVVSLLNPAAAVEIRLPPLRVVYEIRQWLSVSKVVFAPRPARDDFAAAAICDADRVAYVTAGAARWAVMDPLRLAHSDYLTDLLYYAAADDGGDGGGDVVYCLTHRGDVHVLRLPQRRRRNPVFANEEAAGPSEPQPESFLLRPAQSAESEGTIDLRHPLPAEFERTIHLWAPGWQRQRQQHHQRNPRKIERRIDLRAPGWQQHRQRKPKKPLMDDDAETFIPSPYKHLRPESSQRRRPHLNEPESSEPPHLNDPATIEPLLSDVNSLPFNPATAFAPPYDTVSEFTGAKNLVLCEGSLYQVWRNMSCTVVLNLPAGGQRCRVAENEILVFRYCPRRQPCWDVVKDLGGHSFFVGRNNAVSMYGKGVPGLRGNCVYWIGGPGRDQAMVFDMESGTSTPCSAFELPGHPHSTTCWYFP